MTSALLEFDDLAEHTTVSDRYAPMGITFVEPPRGGPLPSAAPGSFGSKILQLRDLSEPGWCEARALFDRPRSKLGVALMNLRDMPVKLTLSAQDAAGHQIASVSVRMSPSAGATAFLELVQPSPAISSFLISSASMHDRWAIQWLAFDEATPATAATVSAAAGTGAGAGAEAGVEGDAEAGVEADAEADVEACAGIGAGFDMDRCSA